MRPALALLLLMLLPVPALAKGKVDTEPVLVSATPEGTPANANSSDPWLSGNGRWLAFVSPATDLVEGGTSGEELLFLRDRKQGTTTLLSATADGVEADAYNYQARLSKNGRWIAFTSAATNLGPGPINGENVYLKDRKTGDVLLVSRTPAGLPGEADSFTPSISGNGRLVAFETQSTDLVDGDPSSATDVVLFDRKALEVSLVSTTAEGVAGNGSSGGPWLSKDGRYVAFHSLASDLVAGDGNGKPDIFVRDLKKSVTERVSLTDGGDGADGSSSNPSASRQARRVAFQSFATNLVEGDDNGLADIFVRDRKAGTTTLVSAALDGGPGNGSSSSPTISSNGRWVAFRSYASDLVEGDDNGVADVFLRDLKKGVTVRLQRTEAEPDGTSSQPAISANGRWIIWWTDATNQFDGDVNDALDVVVAHR